MTKGHSLHIGLNSVDPVHYSGWSGPLNACEADAQDMHAIANSRAFESSILLTKSATRDAVASAMNDAANSLKSGDILFLSYSGHGGQVPDLQDEEPDGMDETWCLYDGQVVDDELWQLYSQFAEGVRILILSDSCHSGSVARAPYSMLERENLVRGSELADDDGSTVRYRAMPSDVALRVFRDNPDFYIPLLEGLPARGEHAPMSADVRLISGCQDNQLSLDGNFNGLFTGTLLRVWKNGRFNGDYQEFHKKIVTRMPPTQTPNHARYGQLDPTYDTQIPFTI
jgi:hypothetical protein